MGIADSMKAITEDIIASHDLRVKALGELVADTHKTLEDARKKVGRFAKDRKRVSKEQAEELAIYVEDLSKTVKDMVSGFHKARMQMSGEQSKTLANFVAELRRNVADLRKNAKEMIKEFASDREGISKEQSKVLADFVAELSKNVGNLIKGFQADRKKMSKDQAKALRDFVADLSNYVDNLIKGFQAGRKELSEELKRMSALWQGMTATMAKKRGGKPVKVEVGEETKTVEEVVKEKPKKAKPKTVEDQILVLLKKYPGGLSLKELGEEMGCHFLTLVRPMKGLLEQGKVSKDENLYFIPE